MGISDWRDDLRIAAIVPCHNEEQTVATVVRGLRAAVPGMDVYVYDNLSTDETSARAAEAGAIVRREDEKGKGNVVRRAFADIDADVYVLIDGDDTYDAAAVPQMISELLSGPYDHVLGVRQETGEGAYRPGHSWGNRMFNRMTSALFSSEVNDMFSGYRVMSRRFVKSFPAVSREFEIETELTIHYMSLRVPHTEIPVGFKDRPEGSESKLRTFHDGFQILGLLLQLLRHDRPLLFHGILGTLVVLIGFVVGIPVLVQFAPLDRVIWIPTAVLASSLVLLGVLIWMIGLILDAIARNRTEIARLAYLRFPPAR